MPINECSVAAKPREQTAALFINSNNTGYRAFATELLLRDGNQCVSSLEVVPSRTSRKSFSKSIALHCEN